MISPGVYPASVTPFDEAGRIDLPGVARLLAWFRARGCAGVVLAGTTGEGPSLSAIEKRDLIRGAVPLAQGLPVILGIATDSVEEAVWACRQAQTSGAAAALVMPPAFFRETGEEGIGRWFESLLNRSPIGILLYNFPQRTGIALSPELVARLAQHEQMIGLKDSSGDRANIPAYAEAAKGKSLFVGDETLLVEALAAGWSGAISGAANSLPDWLCAIVDEWKINEESARTKHALILPALEAIRRAPQPTTNKEILRRRGVIDSSRPRIPLLSPPVEVVSQVWEHIAHLARP